MDRPGADFPRVLEMMQSRLNTVPVAVQIPVGAEDEFRGVIDLVQQKAIMFLEDTLGSDFEVEEIPEQDIQNESVSSTKIRMSLLEGNIQKANAYLDHFYIVMGPAKPSNLMLAEIGFPSYTIQVEEDCKLVPPNGVYAVTVNGGVNPRKGMCFIRKNQESPIDTLVEVHLTEGNEQLANKILSLYFHKRLREEKTMTSLEDLRKQLQIDKSQIDELIF